MKQMPKPTLWWSDYQDGNHAITAVLNNKNVWLHARDVRQSTPFRIMRRNLLSRIPRMIDRMFASYVLDVPTVDINPGRIRSEFDWQASFVAFNPAYEIYFFVDGNGGKSGTLTVSNMVTFDWKEARRRNGFLNPELIVDLSQVTSPSTHMKATLGEVGSDYESTLTGWLIAPQDPEVEIEILSPRRSARQLLDIAIQVLTYEFKDLESGLQGEYIESGIEHIMRYLEPSDFDIDIIGETRMLVTADEPYPVTISLKGSGPVRSLLAVQVRDLITGEVTTSELMPVVILPPR